jgi:PD-(D/E)XK nuclease superfamily
LVLRFEAGYRADLIVEKKVLLELKSIETLLPVHAKQVLTYIRLANLRVGLLINFGETRLKNGIKRFGQWLIPARAMPSPLSRRFPPASMMSGAWIFLQPQIPPL